MNELRDLAKRTIKRWEDVAGLIDGTIGPSEPTEVTLARGYLELLNGKQSQPQACRADDGEAV